MSGAYAFAGRVLRDVKAAMKPRPRVTVSTWADANRRVPGGTTPEPGPWDTSRTPYLREPMDACSSRHGSVVVLMFSSQVGKSEAMLNVMGYYASQEPSSQLLLQPTLAAAESFSRERIEPTIRATPCLAAAIDQRERQRGTTKLRKDYPGGYLALVGSNSPAGLASRPIRILLCDEVDRYVETREGDPVKLAVQRTVNFPNRHILLASTPTVSGSSCIESWWARGDRRVFLVRCPGCGEPTRLTWQMVRWDRGEDGRPDPQTSRIECPSCGCVIHGSGRIPGNVLSTGFWKPTAEGEKGIRSYHLSALYSPWIPLSSLVEEFLNATANRDQQGLREFVNLKLGEPWDDSSSSRLDWQVIRDRRDDYGPESLPEGVLALTCGVDVQRDRLEATIYGWGAGKERWGVEHRVIWGAPDSGRTWEDLAVFLSAHRQTASGRPLHVACTLVDSGDGVTTRDVYAFTRRNEASRVFACKGRGGSGVPIAAPPTRRNSDGAYLINVGTDAAKEALVTSLSIETPGPGRVHYPAGESLGFTEEFFRQLLAEKMSVSRRNGFVRREWTKTRERNEALDCAVYAHAALELVRPDFSALAAMGRAQQPAPSPVREPPRRRPASRGVEI